MAQSRLLLFVACVLVTLAAHERNVSAQVGKGSIIDVNTASEKDLASLPHLTPAIVKGVLEKRPFTSVVD